MKTFLNKLREKPLDNLIMRLLSAWCVSSVFLFFYAPGDFTELEGYEKVPLWLTLGLVALFFAVFSVVRLLAKKEVDHRILPVCFSVYSVLTVLANQDWYYVFLLTALWAALVFYYQRKGLFRPKKPFTEKRGKKTLIVLAVVFVVFVGAAGAMKYLSYRTPNFDFGIFSQMFYSMKTKLLPMTTCERDKLLSHFAVHISPICYLLLPVYAVFSSPVTLQICQALILASAVIPLILLCRALALGAYKTVFLSAIFLLYPAVSCGTNYDFHENCFLLPLLFWVFYFFEKKKYPLMAVFAVLTLLVKEDAAVYLIFFALFIILDRKKYAAGVSLAAGAACWFAVALILLSRFGDGVMESRYQNFIVADGGLAEAVRNVLANPGYALTQLLVNKEGDLSEKLLFLFQLFVPLAFLPFCVKRLSRLTLLFPLLLINLLTVYRYQFDLGFQYAFGTTAFLFYLCAINLTELREDTAKRVFAVSLFACALCFIIGPAARFLN